MTNVEEPRQIARGTDDGEAVDAGELALLVRRWVGARSEAPALVDADLLEEADLLVESGVEPDGRVATDEPAIERAPRRHPLPHRPAAGARRARRRAVLIDARRISEDVAAALLGRLGEGSPVDVCRAYADWSRSDVAGWVEGLRHHGMQSFHQFADDDDQALVAMAIDAIDLAREASVDEVVIAGDMTSMLPLVHRLHAAGVRVVVVGPGHTPPDVRAACDDFLDAGRLAGQPVVPAGRHRA